MCYNVIVRENTTRNDTREEITVNDTIVTSRSDIELYDWVEINDSGYIVMVTEMLEDGMVVEISELSCGSGKALNGLVFIAWHEIENEVHKVVMIDAPHLWESRQSNHIVR